MAQLPATPADGNVYTGIVATIANAAAPTVTELGTAVDISCYLTSDGFSPSLSEQTIADERLCSTATYEQPGRYQRSLDVIYIDNSNTEDANEARETLVPGEAMFLVVRRGKAFDAPIEDEDEVSVWPIKPGQYSELPPEANSVLKTAQKLFVTGEVEVGVKVTDGS